MSGFIIGIIEQKFLEKFQRQFALEETNTYAVNQSHSIVFVSKDGKSVGANFFRGFAVDHVKKACIFPGAEVAGLPEPSNPVDGSYVVCRSYERKIQIGADITGFTSILWFREPGMIVISDSFLSLLALRKRFGLTTTLDRETAQGRMWDNAICNQQLNSSTYCREIQFLTPGSHIEYDTEKNSSIIRLLNLVDFYSGSNVSHSEAVRESVHRMVGMLTGLAASGGLVSLSFSGGIDSRAVLSACLRSDLGESLRVVTSPKTVKDYQVASDISAHMGFRLNPRDKDSMGVTIPTDPLALWAGASMGIYDFPYSASKFRQLEVPLYGVGGHGAGASKGGFGWRSLQQIAMPSSTSDAAYRGIEEIGADRENPIGSEWHFLAYRNAIHGGRAGIQTDYITRPLSQVPLVKLSRSDENELKNPKHGKSVVLDLLIVLSKELSLLPFDDPRKLVSESYYYKRLESLGGPISTFEITKQSDYRILGKPKPSTGLSRSILEMAQDLEYSGRITPKNFARIYGARKKLDQDLLGDLGSKMVQYLKTNSHREDWFEGDAKSRATKRQAMASKLLTLQAIE